MAGSVIIGRRDEAKGANDPKTTPIGSSADSKDTDSATGSVSSRESSARKASGAGSLKRKPKKSELRAR